MTKRLYIGRLKDASFVGQIVKDMLIDAVKHDMFESAESLFSVMGICQKIVSKRNIEKDENKKFYVSISEKDGEIIKGMINNLLLSRIRDNESFTLENLEMIQRFYDSLNGIDSDVMDDGTAMSDANSEFDSDSGSETGTGSDSNSNGSCDSGSASGMVSDGDTGMAAEFDTPESLEAMENKKSSFCLNDYLNGVEPNEEEPQKGVDESIECGQQKQSEPVEEV